MLIGAVRSVIAVAVVFAACIVIHEFGHYYVAKRCGVAVPAFAIGFGPKLIRWVRRGTEFSIRLFPIGGLVQLAGEIPQEALFRTGEIVAVELGEDGRVRRIGDPADLPGGLTGKLKQCDLTDAMTVTLDHGDSVRTYRVMPHARLITGPHSSIPLVEKHEQVLGKPLWQRALIIAAGPLMNFVLAGLLFSAFYVHTGLPVDEPRLGQVVPGSPAAVAGLHEGDRVLAVDGHPVRTWTDLVNQIRADRSMPPAPLTLSIMRDGHAETIVVTPRRTAAGVPQLGVNPPVERDAVRAVGAGFSSVWYGTANVLQMYGQVIRHHEFNNLAGPVGIADVISQEAQSGFWHVVMIAGLLSLNLGLFNLLPIPALDGGRLLFMLVEVVRGKALDPNKEGLVHLMGFALLMLFAVLITYRDVTRLF
jgi:regulator of sigma E protease